ECGTQNDLHFGIADGSVDGSRLKPLQRGGDLQLATLAGHCQNESPVRIGDRGEAHALDRNGRTRKRASVALRRDPAVDALRCQRTDEHHDDEQSTSKLQHWQLPYFDRYGFTDFKEYTRVAYARAMSTAIDRFRELHESGCFVL